MKNLRWIRAAIAAAALLSLSVLPGAAARALEVDLELVLAVDISRSMDVEEQILQRDGFVAAFRHPDVIRAIEGGMLGRIAATYVQWSGAYLQRVVVPWSLIDSAESARTFAERIAAGALERHRRTSISGAIEFAAPLFADNGFAGLRRVIDVSGDGPNNQGERVDRARDRALAQGLVINGLPIVLKRGSIVGFYDIENLEAYYEDCVIGGPGSFLLAVRERGELATAIRRKLILEIAGRAPRLIPAQAPPERAPVDCLIGEKLWQERWRVLE
ncbi:MAG TPA: DUF1194 domain-containing protein [Kiloniellales bacterium]|nr:DUF1194 domain-containing protein [Kiloniellales bacterium]